MAATFASRILGQRLYLGAAAAAGAATLFSQRASAARLEQPAPMRTAAATEEELEKLLDGAPRLVRLTGNKEVARSDAAKAEFEDAAHSLIHGHTAPGEFERFDLWVDAEGARTLALVRIGGRMCGHRGIVHGGATAAICDELFGWTAHHCGPDQPTQIYTANLNVNYKAPLVAGTTFLVSTTLKRVEGRKLFLETRVESLDGETVFATATALFIIARANEKGIAQTEGTPVY